MTSVFSLSDQSDAASEAGWYQNLNLCEILGGEEGDWRMRRFWVAIRSNDVPQLMSLLRAGVDPNVPNYEGHGELALTEATYRGYSAMVEVLLEVGADVNARNIQGETALHVAAHPYRFDTKIFLLFLDNPSSNFNIQDHKGYIPLHVLVRNIVQRRSGSSVPSDTDEMLVILKLLVQKSNVNRCSHSGDTPLHIAVSGSHENIDALKILIVGGADFNLSNERHETPLLTAINCSHPALATTLINLGSDLTVRDDNLQTAMHRAAQTNLPSVVRHLVAQGCDVNSVDKMGDTALHLAAGRGYVQVVESLLQDHNIRILKENNQKHTPLHCALASGFLNVAQILFTALSIPFQPEVNEDTFQSIDEYLAKRYPLREPSPRQSSENLTSAIPEDVPGDHAPAVVDFDTGINLTPLLEPGEYRFIYTDDEAGDYKKEDDEDDESEPIPKPPPIVIKMESCKAVNSIEFEPDTDEIEDKFMEIPLIEVKRIDLEENNSLIEPLTNNSQVLSNRYYDKTYPNNSKDLFVSNDIKETEARLWNFDSPTKLNSSSINLTEDLKFTPEAPISDFGKQGSQKISEDLKEICSRFYGMKQQMQYRPHHRKSPGEISSPPLPPACDLPNKVDDS